MVFIPILLCISVFLPVSSTILVFFPVKVIHVGFYSGFIQQFWFFYWFIQPFWFFTGWAQPFWFLFRLYSTILVFVPVLFSHSDFYTGCVHPFWSYTGFVFLIGIKTRTDELNQYKNQNDWIKPVQIPEWLNTTGIKTDMY